MKQAIAGVTPSATEEVTSMIVWPSVSATGLGRTLGKLYSIRFGQYVLTVGNLIALASIPLAAVLYLFRLAPSFYGGAIHGVSYKLTNRRVVELRNEIRGGSFKLVHVLLLVSNIIPTAIISGLLIYNDWVTLGIALAAGAACLFVLSAVLQWWPHFQFGAETRSVHLDRFDQIRIEVRPGQQWFYAGDLVFLQGDVETFRLPGVSRPESFKTACLKAHVSYVGVQKAMDRQPAVAAS